MRRAWIALNLVLGPLVLVSYVASALYWPSDVVAGLWGAVPASWQPLYTANMFLAAGGYFAFGHYILRRVEPDDVEVFGRFGFGVFVLAYALVLGGSVLWMPLTCVAIDGALGWMVPVIVVVLATVAAGSLLVLAAVFAARPVRSARGRWAAVVGALFFCLQTVVLDAIVWPLHFTV